MEEVQEDEVLFENTDEYLVIVTTISITLTHAIAHNVTMLNGKMLHAESENTKLKDRIISLRDEMNKRRKVENYMISLKENILEQQEKLHDVKVECFNEIQKMDEKVKSLEKHLNIMYPINLKMESLQTKINELDIWKSMEKIDLSILLVVKTYDIMLHIVDDIETSKDILLRLSCINPKR